MPGQSFVMSQVEKMDVEDAVDHLDALSQQWHKSIRESREHVTTPYGDNVLVLKMGHDPRQTPATEIAEVYRTLMTRFPSKRSVRRAYAVHLWRNGDFYHDAVSPGLLRATAEELFDVDLELMDPKEKTNDSKKDDEENFKFVARLHRQVVDHAEEAAAYYYESFSLEPMYSPAFGLGELFREAGFFGSALHWYQIAAPYVSVPGRERAAAELARSVELVKRAGKTSDPTLASIADPQRGRVFPSKRTKALPQELQEQAEALEARLEEERLEQERLAAEKREQERVESERRIADEKARQEKIKAEAEEREQARRLAEGLCLNCGAKLGFLDKMTGKKVHSNC